MAIYTSALITGASSGIGRALAVELAAPGVTLHLGGRDKTRLEETATLCRTVGATAHPRVVDVTDAAAMHAWITSAGRLDLVVANAGISGGTGQGDAETAAQTRLIMSVNLDGALNTILPALEHMAAQPLGPTNRRGTIAAIASIAGFLPTPGAPAYGAGKAALDAWTIASSPAAAAQGILLTSVCPGFVRTAMTATNTYRMPGLMDADRAARIILAGLAAGHRRIVFPRWIALLARAVSLMPFRDRLMARLPTKSSLPPSTPRSPA